MKTLAAIATMPGRPLAVVLRALRPQVDRLHVYSNGRVQVPDAVRALADEWREDPENLRGSAGKFAWADTWDGLYLGCDDDLLYPSDYVATMRAAVAQWDGRVIVTTHGRVLRPTAVRFDDAAFVGRTVHGTPGQWLNYAGACGVAFHTALGVPAFTRHNVEEPELAVWAQQQRVPIWLLPHRADWITSLLPPTMPPGSTIWLEEKAMGFRRRNAVLAPIGMNGGWQVHTP
jgi:hypothetical protein